MGFLIKAAFWLSLVILFIPVSPDDRPEAAAATPLPAIDTFEAAQATVSDLGGFCFRNPGVCEAGGEWLTTFALKARTGAQMLYEFIDGQLSDPSGSPAASGTLTPTDRATEWRGTSDEA